MRYILFFLLLWSTLWATCTQEQIAQSERLYTKANQAQTALEQIELLQVSLERCYAPEIEASLLILQAQQAKTIEEKIAYYKQALIPISMFSDKHLLIQEQNKLNKILYKLYTPIDKEIADVYRKKVIVIDNKQKEKSKHFEYGIYLLFSLLFLWAFWEIFRKK